MLVCGETLGGCFQEFLLRRVLSRVLRPKLGLDVLTAPGD